MAKKSKKVKITSDDLKAHSLNEMLKKSYGKKGTPNRVAAEKRIKEKAKNLLSDNKKKEAKENEEKKSLKKRIKKIKVQINYIHYRKGKKVKVTKGSMFINQDTADALKELKNGKSKKSGKSIKSNNVIGSPKKAVGNKARAGKKNAVRKRNSKK